MQFFKPDNHFEVRQGLIAAGRGDLIGGCDGLILPNPPKEAMEKRRRGRPYHTVANPAHGEKPGERGPWPVRQTGYRLRRKSQQRRPGKDQKG